MIGHASKAHDADTIGAYLADPTAPARIWQEALDRSAQGRIDVLVNNAGITRRADLLELTEGDWDRITRVNAKGAFYLFPNISGTGLKSSEFCAKLLEQEKVAAVPGVAFGADDYIRLSYATGMANIEKGLERIERFVRSLKR